MVARSSSSPLACIGICVVPVHTGDMDRQLEVEAGFPVAAPVTGKSQVIAAVLAVGRYATLWHTGHPDGLAGATRTLLDWALSRAWPGMSHPRPMGRGGIAAWRFITTNPARP
jgi:hypothetical protein